MSPKQRELAAKHGTPEQFAAACNRAADTLYITTAECDTAVAAYIAEWEAAA